MASGVGVILYIFGFIQVFLVAKSWGRGWIGGRVGGRGEVNLAHI
jgi:hypothetical protein